MRPVTVWVSCPDIRRVDGTLAVVATDRSGADYARSAYRAMRRAGIESWDARSHVLRLLSAGAGIICKGGGRDR